MDHTSLSILAVPPEPSLSAYTKYGIQATITSGPAQEILVFIALASSDGSIQYNTNTIQLFYCFISFHMRHSQNTFINMFNINTKNDISFSIMLNKRSI